jgi:hypothetical protein
MLTIIFTFKREIAFLMALQVFCSLTSFSQPLITQSVINYIKDPEGASGLNFLAY